jgi:hypothetical protein
VEGAVECGVAKMTENGVQMWQLAAVLVAGAAVADFVLYLRDRRATVTRSPARPSQDQPETLKIRVEKFESAADESKGDSKSQDAKEEQKAPKKQA